jgi:uncharacterized phage protein gp47/JayE
MALEIKDRQTIIRDMENEVKSRDSSLEVGFGPVKDVVIDPVSLVARDLYTQVKNVFDIQFLKNAATMSIEELNLLGESFGIKRKSASSATGTVFFRTTNKPPSDIRIPSGIPVATSNRLGATTIEQFVTTRAVTLPSAAADSFFNATEGVFEIEAAIRALTPGSRGLVAANTIITIQRQVQGISAVINKSSTVGGKDFESNTEYARRIQLALMGLERGTVNGLKRFSLTDNRVIDSIVVQSGDSLMIRAEDVAGAIDVYILGEEPTVVTQTETYNGLDIPFDNEPIIYPSPVIEVRGDVVGVLTEGTHFFVVRDIVLEGSTTARNVVRWNRGSTGLPSSGEGITIQYTYDKLIEDLQTSIDNVDNDVLGDVLMRRATEVDILLEANIRVDPSADLSATETLIRSAIKDFVNVVGLGENIVPSDLDLVIRQVPGVDFVFLPFEVLDKSGGEGSDIVTIEKNEYAQISDVNMTLTLSV